VDQPFIIRRYYQLWAPRAM